MHPIVLKTKDILFSYSQGDNDADFCKQHKSVSYILWNVLYFFFLI